MILVPIDSILPMSGFRSSSSLAYYDDAETGRMVEVVLDNKFAI